jgi:hypothetical protein
MRKRTLNTDRHRSSNSPPRNRRLSSAKHTDIHGRQIALVQSNTSSMQPLIARLALYHELIIVVYNAVADAACAFARKTASVGRGRSSGTSIEGVREGVVVAAAVGRGGVHLGGGLGPALVVCFEGVLGCTF